MIEYNITINEEGVHSVVTGYVFGGLGIYLKKVGKGVKHWPIIHIASGMSIGQRRGIIQSKQAAIDAVGRLNELPVIWQWITLGEIALSGSMTTYRLETECIKRIFHHDNK